MRAWPRSGAAGARASRRALIAQTRLTRECPCCHEPIAICGYGLHVRACETRAPKVERILLCACGRLKPATEPLCCRCDGSSDALDLVVAEGRPMTLAQVRRSYRVAR